jgi:hypothetical protein
VEFLEETRVVKLRSPIQGVAKACKLLTSFFADINLPKVLRVISSGDGSSDPILGGCWLSGVNMGQRIMIAEERKLAGNMKRRKSDCKIGGGMKEGEL